MNQERLKELEAIGKDARLVYERLTALAEVQREAVDNTPENFQATEAYERRDEAAEQLESMSSDLGDIVEEIETALMEISE